MSLMGLGSLIWPMAMAEKAKQTEILNAILLENQKIEFSVEDVKNTELTHLVSRERLPY